MPHNGSSLLWPEPQSRPALQSAVGLAKIILPFVCQRTPFLMLLLACALYTCHPSLVVCWKLRMKRNRALAGIAHEIAHADITRGRF